jgi:hypothetical protein
VAERRPAAGPGDEDRTDAYRLAFDVAAIGMALVEVDDAGHGQVVSITPRCASAAAWAVRTATA